MASKRGGNEANDPTASLRKALQPDSAAGQPSQVKLTKILVPAVDVPALAEALRQWYETQGLEAGRAATPSGQMVQCRTRQAWKRTVAMDVALTVTLRHDAGELLVEIGEAKWSQRFASGAGIAVGGLLTGGGAVIAPAAGVMAGVGARHQQRLRQQTIGFLRATAPAHILGGRAPEASRSSGTVAESPASPRPPAGSAAPGSSWSRPDRPARAGPPGPRVDIATATVDQLAAVPGLDEASAYLIVQERTHGAGFRSLADVRRLLADRIGPHEFRVLEARLTLTQPTIKPSVKPRREARDIG